MSFKKELIIIRHARSAHNIRENDDLDCSITKFGRLQAKNVGQFLKKHMDIHTRSFRMYTSPFWRCLQTSAIINKELNTPLFINVEERLKEYINHSGTKVFVPNRCKTFSDFFVWCSYPVGGIHCKQEWNEDLVDRIWHAYDDLDDRSIVVTHGLPAMLLMRAATGKSRVVPLWDHSLDNCSITYIVKGSVIWRGRNLFHECDYDPFDKKRAFDLSDSLR